jgi:peptidoglycan-associated lipoprotein
MLRRLFLIPALSLIAGVALLNITACPKTPPPPEPEPDLGPHYDGPEPIIRSVDPSSAKEGELVDLTIFGQYFRSGITAYVGRSRCGNTSLLDGETIRCTAPTGLSVGTHDVRVVNSDTSEATLARAFRVDEASNCSLQRIYFDYDKAELTSGARHSIEENAECIQKRGFGSVRIEGHADERGSTEYNLALGQRRADSVKKYMINLGVSASVLRTISYGEEKPAERGTGEASYAKNRRAEVVAE